MSGSIAATAALGIAAILGTSSDAVQLCLTASRTEYADRLLL
jgi:hypothetical protein